MEQPSQDPLIQEVQRLQTPASGRRVASWLLFVVIIAGFLLAPLWVFYRSSTPTTGPNTNATETAAGAANSEMRTPSAGFQTLDAVWNPGPLDHKHHAWSNDCRACHTAPFVRVQDKDCQACHQRTGPHVAATTTAPSHATDAGSGPDSLRCATCHRDHWGEFGLAQQNKLFTQSRCATCHQDIRRSTPQTQTQNVRDFVKDHPEFRIQINNPVKPQELIRTRMHGSTPLRSASGLKFPHDVHLDSLGVDSPEGKVKVTCQNCHRTSKDQSTFEPVRFEQHCRSCHEMRFDPAVVNREIPHGSVDQVLSTLREFYGFMKSRPPVPVRDLDASPLALTRPGKPESPIRSYVHFNANDLLTASAAATAVFEKTTCVVCHEPQRVAGPGRAGTTGQDMPQWTIPTMAPAHAWMPQSRFDHRTHQLTECKTCHAAEKSSKASDVLMPGIAICRECHAPTSPAAQRASSDCGTCHSFHTAAKAPLIRAKP
jgi:predicted CXXCH cytochrome family protein